MYDLEETYYLEGFTGRHKTFLSRVLMFLQGKPVLVFKLVFYVKSGSKGVNMSNHKPSDFIQPNQLIKILVKEAQKPGRVPL